MQGLGRDLSSTSAHSFCYHLLLDAVTPEGQKILQHLGFTSINDPIAKRLGFRLIKNHRPGFVLEETEVSDRLLRAFESTLFQP